MKNLRITWIAAAVAVVVLAFAGVAIAAGGATGPATAPGAAAGVNCDVTDPAALAEIEALRADFQDARQAWFDKYDADRTSDEAQAELQTLRDEYQADVQSVLEEYGVDATAGSQAGYAGDGAGQGGAMMGAGSGQGAMTGDGSGACITD